MRSRLTAALAATLLATPGIALARPTVALTMTGSTVVRTADGREAVTPLATGAALRPGTVVRYAIDAANTGAEAARDVRPQARVPLGTALVAASPTAPPGASVEYSIDGGKSWAAHPTLVVRDAAGTASTIAAPSDRYTAIRWLAPAALPHGAHERFSYEVTVK